MFLGDFQALLGVYFLLASGIHLISFIFLFSLMGVCRSCTFLDKSLGFLCFRKWVIAALGIKEVFGETQIYAQKMGQEKERKVGVFPC